MADTEGELWWYRTLHHLVAEALKTHPKGTAARVMDAGCGTGGLLAFLARQGYGQLAGFDVSPAAVEICQGRKLAVQRGDLREWARLTVSGSTDAIISNDTFYFFEPAEQEQIMRAFWKALGPGGLVILNLPALACFQGTHDQAVGIGRRFTRADVARLLGTEEFETLAVRFWPFLLSPIIYTVRSMQRLRARRPAGSQPPSDVRLPPRCVNGILLGLTRLELAAPSWAPFGSSLFVVARKRHGHG